MADDANPVVTDQETISILSGVEDSGETFYLGDQGSASQLKQYIWPLDCWVIGMQTSIASVAILSRDGNTGFTTDTLTQTGIIAWVSSVPPITGLKVRMRSGERVYIWTTSTQPVAILCRRIVAT